MRTALGLSGLEYLMIDVTYLVRRWIYCSNDLWMRWFSSEEGAAGDYCDIEVALLKNIVLDDDRLVGAGLTENSFIDKLRVIYPVAINESRQMCIAQRAGNIFCSPCVISMSAGDALRVESVNTVGVMQNGRPYVEVLYGGGYFLESPDVVDFAICVD
jgi:hypothetical protein